MHIELVFHYFIYKKVFLPQHNLTFAYNLNITLLLDLFLIFHVCWAQFIHILYRVLVAGPLVNPAGP